MNKWFVLKMIGLALSLISIICIVIAMFLKEGNTVFLVIGLATVCINIVLLMIVKAKEKK